MSNEFPTSRRRTRAVRAALATLAVGGVVLGGAATAGALTTPSASSATTSATSTTTPAAPATSPSGAPSAPAAPGDGQGAPGPGGPGGGPGGGPAGGPGAGAPAPVDDGSVHGDVTAVSSDSITVSKPAGPGSDAAASETTETTVSLTGDTTVVRETGPGQESSAAASDIAVGDHVHITAVDPDASELVAAEVRIMPTPPAPGEGGPAGGPGVEGPGRIAGEVHGDVTAVSSDSITVTKPAGPAGDDAASEKTVALTGDTVVQREVGPGQEPTEAVVSDIAVGDHVHVTPVDPDASDLVAATVTIMPTPPAPPAGGPTMAG